MTSLKIVVAVAALCASFGALATGVLIPVNFSGATDASGHLVAEAYKEQSTCVIWSLPAAIIPAMPYEIYTNGFQTPTGGISVLIPTLSISQQTGWRMPTSTKLLRCIPVFPTFDAAPSRLLLDLSNQPEDRSGRPM